MRKLSWIKVGIGWRSWYNLLDENEAVITAIEYPQMSFLIELFDMPEDERQEIFRLAKLLSDERKKG